MQNRTKALCIIVLFVAVFFVASPVSANGDESPQSITFCETLPDDVLFYPDNESHGSGFVESFTLVSDWTTSNTSITTDGDVATITENGAGSTGRAYASFSSTDYFEYYYEFQISTMTAIAVNLEFWDGSVYNTLHTFTTAGTYKGIISDVDATTMQRIGFLVGSNGGNIKPDYLRISPSDEMGWQHDGSTTEGCSQWYGEDWLGYWAMNTGSGVTAFDSGDAELDGTITDASWVSGKIGNYALDFDGVGDYVQISNDASFSGMSALTVSAWVKINNIGSAQTIVFNTNWNSYGGAFQLRIESSGRGYFLVDTDTGSDVVISNVNLVAGEWSHLVGVYDGASIVLYLNNVAGTPWPKTGNIDSVTNDLWIGTRYRNPAGYDINFNGSIDEVMIFNRALSDNEITALYTYGSGTVTSDGSELMLTANSNGSIFVLPIDITTTQAIIDISYYPFFSIDFNDSDSDDYVMIEGYYSGTTTTIRSNQTVGISKFNCNLAVDFTDIESIRIHVNPSAIIRMRFIKIYSIANHTITQSGAGIDDYLYVENGTLYSHISSGTIEANHDPTLDLYHYRGWNVNTSSGSPEVDFYNGLWLGYATATEGEFAYGTTVEDFRLKFIDNANIISLEFNTMEASIFEELFLSTELWGYFGPLGLVIIGYLLIKKDKALGIFMFMVDCLVIAHYLSLVDATPAYWWHIFILLFGVIQCTIQLLDR